MSKSKNLQISELFSDLVTSSISSQQFSTRIAISILTSSIPVLSDKTNISPKFKTAYSQLLNFQPTNQIQLKVSFIYKTENKW